MHQAPTRASWRALCDVVRAWPDVAHFDAVALPYIWEHVEQWPRHVRTTPPDVLRDVARGVRAPLMSLCHTLDFELDAQAQRRLTNGAWAEAVGSPYTACLETISLVSTPVGDEGARAMARAQALRHVRELRLGFSCVSASGLEPLVSSEALSALEVLSLGHLEIGDVGLAKIIAGWRLERVRELDLTSIGLTDTGARILSMHAAALEGLEVLRLDHNRITESGAKALAGAEALRTLKLLSIDYNDIGAAGRMALENSPWLKRATIQCNTAPLRLL